MTVCFFERERDRHHCLHGKYMYSYPEAVSKLFLKCQRCTPYFAAWWCQACGEEESSDVGFDGIQISLDIPDSQQQKPLVRFCLPRNPLYQGPFSGQSGICSSNSGYVGVVHVADTTFSANMSTSSARVIFLRQARGGRICNSWYMFLFI